MKREVSLIRNKKGRSTPYTPLITATQHKKQSITKLDFHFLGNNGKQEQAAFRCVQAIKFTSLTCHDILLIFLFNLIFWILFLKKKKKINIHVSVSCQYTSAVSFRKFPLSNHPNTKIPRTWTIHYLWDSPISPYGTCFFIMVNESIY